MKIYVLTVMFVHVGSLLHQTLVALKRIRLLVVLTAMRARGPGRGPRDRGA